MAFYELVIGMGDRQSIKETGHEPHNDWLLLLHDYGIIGVLFMLNIYLSLIGLLWRLCSMKSPLSLPLISSLMLMTCVQLYSSGLYIKTFGFITGCIGLVVGSYYAELESHSLKR